MGVATKDFHADRMLGIGASEAAAVLGLSPWASPLDVWARKKGFATEEPDNERLLTGRLFEEPIAQLYAARENVLVCGTGTTKIWHPDGLPIFASPDRIVGVNRNQNRGLEIKTVDPRAAGWGEEGTDQIPYYYITQVVIGMAVTGLPEWDVAAFFSPGDFRVYRLKRDLSLEKLIVSRLVEWWNRHVVDDEEPPVDSSEACAEYLARKFPSNQLPMIEADEEAENLMSRLFAIRKQMDETEKLERKIKNLLKARIGGAAGIVGGIGKVTWKKSKDSLSTDWKAVVQELVPPSSLIAKHSVIKPGSRRFLPTLAKQ
ncbi:MAG: YqaJ viral recombinase family protein [Syntrophaceae bacterium]|nr:YqaJ viral recombinase family protein [Syntrophaceae bacterium]